ncbi:MAG: toll/interleukin-1 receptor domain-containing protein [Methanobrevibacter sp.]|uniref:toll/interleukin-1 receptor domain-containing protein n=1 Tax=Methanobrevibacter sp. TaxID=66852 RepID=UPI0025EE6696|nr:toll/interleukin-1 receptor domain-containing protein [Methanobrevibacter sp.]MBQ6100448.1 toll/interleukin-1 receptor domain-containing protein [Methanobrevibacter sp.]
MSQDVFISYSTKDSAIAEKICYALEQNGLTCWIAPRNISSGKSYIDEISKAIKTTKIVVLVFSKNSQESKYVNNEIKMAFTRNKPIISFNIDNSEPEGDMEYHLKVSQWLMASPKPEDKLETLVEDAKELCDIKTDVPVLVDLTNFIPEDLSKHKKDYISLILLFTPIYWASFIYMGISASKKLWAGMGILYMIPSLMIFILYFEVLDFLFVSYPLFKMFNVIFIIFWILAIIHGFVIRNEFLTRKSVLRFTTSDDNLFNYLYEEYVEL